MSKKPSDFAASLRDFFNHYLSETYRASGNTISSYSYTFTLLFRFLQEEKGIPPQKVTISTFDRQLILEFLQWLEEKRGNSIATRNQRLGCIHSYFKFIQTSYPPLIVEIQGILNIHMKKYPKSTLNYLSHDGIKLLLEKPDLSSKQGRRDLLLLTLLYDTGARVSEIINITKGDLFLQNPASVRVLGKGSKFRQIPLMPQTISMLKHYLAENRQSNMDESTQYLFVNPSGQKLTRGGVAYILQKYCSLARADSPRLIPEKFSPHCLRHSKAMHLLQSGVNLIYIRDFLGHTDVVTTEVYAKADPEMKRNALEKAYQEIAPDPRGDWQADIELMGWLKSLNKAK